MGMTLKELLTKGEGTLSAQEAKALAAQCRMDVDTLYTLLEERGIKVLEEENEPSLDVDSIIAEVENAENNNDDMGLADENEEDAEENPADLKAAMDELLDDPVKNYLKQIGQIPLLSAEQEVELSRRIHAGAEAAHILQADRQKYGAPEYIKKNSARFSFEEDENSRSYNEDLDEELGEDEYFGFGVDAGMGCVADIQTQAAFKTYWAKRLEEDPDIDPYNDLFCDLLEENAKAHPKYQGDCGDWLNWTVPDTDCNLPIFASGRGDGYYPVYFGYDAKGEVCAVYVRFIDIEASYKEQE